MSWCSVAGTNTQMSMSSAAAALYFDQEITWSFSWSWSQMVQMGIIWGSARRIFLRTQDGNQRLLHFIIPYIIIHTIMSIIYIIYIYIYVCVCYINPCSSIFINGWICINPSVHQGDVLNQPTRLDHQRARRGCALPRYGRGSWQLLGTEWEQMVLLVLWCNRL